MKRRLLKLLMALSLLLSMAAAALWVRGYWTVDRILVATDPGVKEAGTRHVLSAMSGKGVVALVWETESWDRSRSPRGDVPGELPAVAHETMPLESLTIARDTFWQRAGFNSFHGLTGQSAGWIRRSRGVRVPCWLLLVASGAAPGVGLVRRMGRRRRVSEGLCPRCGYDLRATAGRCPECGTATTTPA